MSNTTSSIVYKADNTYGKTHHLIRDVYSERDDNTMPSILLDKVTYTKGDIVYRCPQLGIRISDTRMTELFGTSKDNILVYKVQDKNTLSDIYVSKIHYENPTTYREKLQNGLIKRLVLIQTNDTLTSEVHEDFTTYGDYDRLKSLMYDYESEPDYHYCPSDEDRQRYYDSRCDYEDRCWSDSDDDYDYD